MKFDNLFTPCWDGAALFVFGYLIARTIVLTALLYFTQPTLTMDVLEHLAWGQEWKMLYWKHPGLNAWINESINLITSGSHLALSATSPMATSLAMLAIWFLARRMTDEYRAAVAALSLEGVYYFNVAAVEFNHNILLLLACAWLIFAAHKAFFSGGRGAWIFLGVAAAVSLYAKYSAVLFLAALFFWSVYEPAARKQWAGSGPALAFAVFLAITAPQLVALVDLQFSPVQFALERAPDARKWSDHIIYPARFAVVQFGACVLAGALCFWAQRSPGTLPAAAPLPPAERRFIFTITFVPLLLALTVSALAGLKLQSMWGSAMVSFIPLWLLLSQRGELRFQSWKIALFGTAALMAVAIVANNLGTPVFLKKSKRIHYPAAAIVQKTEAEWRARYPNAPLRYIIGNSHIASIISFYSPQRLTAVMYGGDWQKIFWASKEDFIKSGGVVVWIMDRGRGRQEKPPAFAAEYLAKGDAHEFSFAYDAPAQIPPLVLGFIFVPPKDNGGE